MNLPDGYFLQEKKYQLTHTIGQGGFGITYLGAWNTEVKGELGKMKTKVPVCIKEYFFKDYCYRDKDSYAVKVHSETGEKLFGKFKEKLIKEANILSAVHHPNIVNVLEVFEENYTAYIIMEYIKGCSLKYMLDKEGVLPENKVLKYTHQIGNALNFVHEKNVVHLDIKPGNILIDRDDNARLIDFGVSKRYDIEEQETSTTTLTLSKGFASIEQYDDEGTQNFSPCPDIYSLGASMYNLLTGVIPVESILRATKKMLPPSAYNSNITPKTENAILKAMEVKPENRFQVVKEMLSSIDIPPYELTENTLIESPQFEEEDSTEVLGTRSGSQITEEDDDRTIAASSGVRNLTKKSRRKNKTKKRLLFSVGVLIFAFFGYAVYSYFFDISSLRGAYTDNDLSEDSIKQNLIATNNNVSPLNQVDSVPAQSDTQQTTQQTTQQATRQNQPNQTRPNNSQTRNNSTLPPETDGNAQLTAKEKAGFEEEYKTFISSGSDKITNKNYLGAIDDLKKAEEIVKKTGITDLLEVKDLLELCNEKLEDQNMEKRLSKYTLYRSLGNLMIAYNKETKLYGAIDAKGHEVIDCKYRTADIHPQGRAFLRDDGNYDLFDHNGDFVTTLTSGLGDN